MRQRFYGILRRLAARLGLDGRLMVVVLDDFGARGVICRRRFRAPAVIERFAAVEFETSERRVKARLGGLFEAFGAAANVRDILIVSEDAALLPVELPQLPKARLAALRRRRLREAVRWEVAPFLDYGGADALCAIWRIARAETDDDELPGAAVPRIPLLVAVARGAVYAKLRQICRDSGHRLVGMLPREVFALAAGELESARFAVIDWRVHDVHCALLEGGVPVRTLSVPAGADPVAVAQGLLAELGVPVPVEIVAGGAGWKPEYGAHFAPAGTVISWTRELTGVAAGGPVPAAFMTAVAGAAGGHGPVRDLTVDDRPGLVEWFMNNAYALPVAVILLMLVIAGGEYWHLNHRAAVLERRSTGLQDRKDELAAAARAETEIRQRYETLKEEKRQLEGDIALLSARIPQRAARQAGLLEGLVRLTPSGIQLTVVEQFSDCSYRVGGRALNYSLINQYVLSLKNAEDVQDCRLESSAGLDAAGKRREGPQLHDFVLRIRLTEA